MSRATPAYVSTPATRAHLATGLALGIVLALPACGKQSHDVALASSPSVAVVPRVALRARPVRVAPSARAATRRPPIVMPTAARIAAIAPAAAATASATPVPVATGPLIYSVSASPSVAHPGDAIKWDAHVSPDVVSVRCRVAVYTFDLYPVRYGHFGETLKIPKDVPPIFHGRYGVTITATSKTGATTSRGISMLFQ